MLFCSLVAVEGSVMPDGGASENAASEDCSRPLMRSTSVTIPAANNPEIRAINKTWRAESLYIKLLLSLNSKSSLFAALPAWHEEAAPADGRCVQSRLTGPKQQNFKTRIPSDANSRATLCLLT